LSLDELNREIEILKQRTLELETLRREKFPETTALKESEEEELLKLLAKDSTIIVKGKLKQNTGIKSITLTQPRSYKAHLKQTLKIEEDGSFFKEFKVKTPGFYILKCGKLETEVFLESNSTLGLIIDSLSRSDLKFVGDLAAENNFLQLKTGRFKQWYDGPTVEELSDSIDFTKRFLVQKEADLNALDSLIQKSTHPISAAFQQMEKATYEFGFARSLLPTKKEYLDTLDLNQTDLFSHYQYRKFLFEYFYSKTNFIENPTTYLPRYSDYKKQFDQINELFQEEKIRELLKTDVLYAALEQVNNSSINPLVKRFQREVKDEMYQRLIDRRYVNLVPVGNGTIAPEIEGISATGKRIKLSDYKGKYVYVFVWATWCAPCKVELPFYEKMIADYAGDNIEFLGVSVDKDKEKWLESFMYDKYPGTQILVRGDWNSPLIQDYKIQSVPHFILIGPNGEILEKDAPRPTKYIRNVLSQYGFDGV